MSVFIKKYFMKYLISIGVEIRLLMYYFLCKFSFLNHMDVSIQNLKTKISIIIKVGLRHRLSQPPCHVAMVTFFFSPLDALIREEVPTDR